MSALLERLALLAAAWLAIAAGARPGKGFSTPTKKGLRGGRALALLPYPAHVKLGVEGAPPLELKPEAAVSLGEGLAETDPAVAALRGLLAEVGGKDAQDSILQDGGGPGGGSLSLLLQGEAAPGSTAEQGYHLNITSEGAVLAAPTSAGLFYAVQTLRQLLSPGHSAGAAAALPQLEISDEPRFRWRGLHLDVSRHFFTPDEVKRLLDTMSLYKLNKFHWHLTDDQGWRVPVEGYPRLTEVGGGGSAYTRQELTDVVAFAQARHIEVIPEIDVPGHVEAVLAAYPDLGNSDIEGWAAPDGPRQAWGISEYTLSPSNATWALLGKVFDVLAEVFPSKVVHIGGDEVSTSEWGRSQAAKQSLSVWGAEQPAQKSAEVLLPEMQVANLFGKRVAELLEVRGRRAMAWDEMQHTETFPSDGIVMAWNSMREALTAVKAGRQVVIANMGALYFDWAQGPREPASIGGCTSWQGVYGFDPLSEGLEELPEDQQSLVLGAQGQLWSEYFPNWTHVEYMAHPRSLALAEKTWSPRDATQDVGEFGGRLRTRLGDLDRLGVHYRGLGADGCAGAFT